MFYHKEYVYVYGGMDSNSKAVGEVHRFDLLQNMWERVGCIMPPKYDHTTVVLGNRAFTFGGISEDNKYSNELLYLDLRNMEWGRLPSNKFAGSENWPEARSRHICVAFEGSLVVHGGSGSEYFHKIHLINVDRMECHLINVRGELKQDVKDHAAAVVGGKLVMCGGKFSGGKYSERPSLNSFDLRAAFTMGRRVGRRKENLFYDTGSLSLFSLSSPQPKRLVNNHNMVFSSQKLAINLFGRGTSFFFLFGLI